MRAALPSARSFHGFLSVSWLAVVSAAACSGSPARGSPTPGGSTGTWAIVEQGLPGALMSIWGTSPSDVWASGADSRDGQGPLVMHYDGSVWRRLDTGQTSGDLWWVFGFPGGPIFFGGSGGVVLRYQGGTFTKMATPGTDTVFGLWGDSPFTMWAVGGRFDTMGFAWRLQGGAWAPEPSLPASVVADAAIWKAFGRSASDVWLVGSQGVSFHWDGTALTQAQTGVGTSLFTVHANETRYAAVGGTVSGVVVESDGGGWTIALGDATYGLTGICLGHGESGYAVGQYASVYARDANGWHAEDTGLDVREDLHSVWMDSSGGIWAVGGQLSNYPLTDGVLLHKTAGGN